MLRGVGVITIFFFLLIALTIVEGACCFRCYRIQLPNGYALVRPDYGAIHIQDGIEGGSRIVVGPHVERYAVVGRFVIGYVVHVPEDSEAAESNKTTAVGYFILDSSVGDFEPRLNSVIDGLGEDEWRLRLRRAGIDLVPKLEVPSRWDTSAYVDVPS